MAHKRTTTWLLDLKMLHLHCILNARPCLLHRLGNHGHFIQLGSAAAVKCDSFTADKGMQQYMKLIITSSMPKTKDQQSYHQRKVADNLDIKVFYTS